MPLSINQKLKEWFVTPSTGLHLDLADGLRGLAILMVVCGHGFYYNPEGPRLLVWIGHFIGTGWVGVRVFFVLSGFLISLPFFRAREKDSHFWYVPGYSMRRIMKIFPPFYAVIVVLALYYFWHYGDSDYFNLGLAWGTGWAHLHYFPKYFNTSFWSLWVEVGFYLVLPFFFYGLRGVGTKRTGWIMFSALSLLPLILRSVVWRDTATPEEMFFSTSRFPSSLDNFGFGILFSSIYVSYSECPSLHRRFGYLGLTGLIMLCFTCVFFALAPEWVASGKLSSRTNLELGHLLPGLSAFLMLFNIFNPNGVIACLLGTPALRFLGIVSYEWFLIHQPLQVQFREWFSSAHGSFFRYAFMVVTPTLLSLLGGILFYRGFSLPILQWGRKKSQGKSIRLRKN